jgi:tRNA(Ile)-lysidine synthase
LSFHKTQGYLQQAQDMVDDAAIMVYQQVAQQDGDTIYFDLKKLQKLPNYKSYLYQWLNEFGFKAWDDIYDLVDSQSGKCVYSSEYRLLKDRDSLLLSRLNEEDEIQEYSILENQKEVNIPLNLSFCKVADISIGSNKTIFVDADKIHYPLVLRHWNEGDHFQPFGMDGKSKKISKLFKDEKLSLIEKESKWLLCSNTEIVWVIGLRQDERFRIDNTTKNILKIQLE